MAEETIGLPRELYRMQLRELGVRILTTDPDDHADDDSLVGEMVRMLRGYQAEQELNNIRRRTMGGTRAKAEGRTKNGTVGERKLIGNGARLYGYNYVLGDDGKRCGFELNYSVIHVDETGEEWTEVKVVIFIFESSVAGYSVRQIAEMLNEKRIPPPSVTKQTKIQRRTGPPVWQPTVVNKMLKHPAYWGEYPQFRTLTGEKKPGKKTKARIPAPAEHQVITTVPAIVSKELAEAARTLMRERQMKASRNNPNPKESLLRAGLVKCGECGMNMRVSRRYFKTSDYLCYLCPTNRLIGRCRGCSIPGSQIDDAAWERAIEIIRNPSLVEEKLQQLMASDLMQGGKLDKGTSEFLSGELQLLAKQEETCLAELAKEQLLQDKYNQLQARIAEFHQRCLAWRENIDDAEFTPSYQFKRDACEFFGITAIVYRHGHDPRFEIQATVPSLVSLISCPVATYN